MVESKCPHHADHENRISRLEELMDKVLDTLSNHKLLAIVLGFIGTMVSAIGACIGVLITVYLKVGPL
ncbi:MAG TPA: hypothetical protein PKI71_01620 [Candidatus Rifleibacterium sp.]|nr:hypothetical protein [Candidatus Rifleibacterium sp.]